MSKFGELLSRPVNEGWRELLAGGAMLGAGALTSFGHTIEPGDNYWNLAAKYDVSVSALKKANPQYKEDALPIGKKLVIPNASKPKKANTDTVYTPPPNPSVKIHGRTKLKPGKKWPKWESRNIISPLDMVAFTLYKEARGEMSKGIEAVATVIYNRAHSKQDNMDFYRVCLRHKQFSPYNDGTVMVPIPESRNEQRVLDYCYKIAQQVVDGTFKPLGNWNHHYNPDLADPEWADELKGAVKIGNHVFGWLTYR